MDELTQVVLFFSALQIGAGCMSLLLASSMVIVFGTKDSERNSRIMRLYVSSCASTLLGIGMKLLTM